MIPLTAGTNSSFSRKPLSISKYTQKYSELDTYTGGKIRENLDRKKPQTFKIKLIFHRNPTKSEGEVKQVKHEV